MKIYHVINRREYSGIIDESETIATTDLQEARAAAAGELYRIERDRIKDETIEIRVYADESEQLDYDTVTIYDSLRVSAIFEDGASIDNDIVNDTGEEAIENELTIAREWFADKDPNYYLISYYFNGECIATDTRIFL